MSSTIEPTPKKARENQQQLRGARAAPPPTVHLDVLELAKVGIAILDFLAAHYEDSVEVIDECKPILERILR